MPQETYIEAVERYSYLAKESLDIGDIIVSIVTAIPAILTLMFSIYFYYKDKRIFEHFERPIVGLENSSCTVQPVGPEYNTNLKLTFKNTGKHPARELKVKLIVINCSGGNPIGTPVESNFGSPNRIDSEMNYVLDFDLTSRDILTPQRPCFIKFVIDYKDDLNQKNIYSEPHWFKCFGGIGLPHATIEEKNRMETFLSTT